MVQGGQTAPEASTPEWLDRDFVAFNAYNRPDQTVCLAFATGERMSYIELHRRADRRQFSGSRIAPVR